MQITLPYCFCKYAKDFGDSPAQLLQFVGGLLTEANKRSFDAVVKTGTERIKLEYLPRTTELEWPQALQHDITGRHVCETASQVGMRMA